MVLQKSCWDETCFLLTLLFVSIGRVTKGFLIKNFEKVDIVEPVKKFSDVIKVNPDDLGALGDVFNVGLQDWYPAPTTYTMIWK